LTAPALLGLIRALPIAGGQVAQLVEQRIENPRVGGSIPPLATIQIRNSLRSESLAVELCFHWFPKGLVESFHLFAGGNGEARCHDPDFDSTTATLVTGRGGSLAEALSGLIFRQRELRPNLSCD
jgi:hypothetical protein